MGIETRSRTLKQEYNADSVIHRLRREFQERGKKPYSKSYNKDAIKSYQDMCTKLTLIKGTKLDSLPDDYLAKLLKYRRDFVKTKLGKEGTLHKKQKKNWKFSKIFRNLKEFEEAHPADLDVFSSLRKFKADDLATCRIYKAKSISSFWRKNLGTVYAGFGTVSNGKILGFVGVTDARGETPESTIVFGTNNVDVERPENQINPY